MNYTEIGIFAFICAASGFTWINYLVDPDGIFSELPDTFWSIADAMKLNNFWRNKLDHMLFVCEKCMAGQIALWLFPGEFASAEHFFAVLLSIFTAAIIHDLWVKHLR